MKSTLALMLGLVLLFGCLQAPGTGTQAPADETAPQGGSGQNVIDVPSGQQDAGPGEAETQPEEESPAEEPVQEQGGDTPATGGIAALESKEYVFDTTDAWEIHGTIYFADRDSPSTAIILLHEAGGDRSSFDSFVPALHEQMPDADIFVMDARGHGESTNLRTWDTFVSGDFKAMKNDVGAAKTYLQVKRPTLKTFYLVGASIGSTTAINYAAGDVDMKKVVMLSPGMEYKGVDISESAERYTRSLYVAASFGDEYSRNSAETLSGISRSGEKEVKIYYDAGDAHGLELFAATENSDDPMMEQVISWLKE